MMSTQADNPRHVEPITREDQLTRLYGLRSQLRDLKASSDSLHLLVASVGLSKMENDVSEIIKLLEADAAGVSARWHSRE